MEEDCFVLEFMCGLRTWFAILWAQHGNTCWTIKSSPLEMLVQNPFFTLRFWFNFISTWVTLSSPFVFTPLIITNILIFNPCLNTCLVFNWDLSVLMASLFFYLKSFFPPWIFRPWCILFTLLLLSLGCTKGNELHTLHLFFLVQFNGLFSNSGDFWGAFG